MPLVHRLCNLESFSSYKLICLYFVNQGIKIPEISNLEEFQVLFYLALEMAFSAMPLDDGGAGGKLDL